MMQSTFESGEVCQTKITTDRGNMYERHRSAAALERPVDPLSRCIELHYDDMFEQLLRQNRCSQAQLDGLLVQAATVGNTTACRALLSSRSNPNASTARLPPLDGAYLQEPSSETFTQSQALDRKWRMDHMPEGGSALHYAVYNGHLDTAQLLMQRGANVNARDKAGLTPLMVAVSRPEITQVAIELILHPTCDVDLRDFRLKRSALHFAVEVGNYVAAETLLTTSVETNSKDRFGNTPLTLACTVDRHSPTRDDTEARKLRCIRALLLAGANINSTNRLNETPLYKAISSRAANIAALLLEVGVECDYKVFVNVTLDIQEMNLIATLFEKGKHHLQDDILCGILLGLILDEASKWQVGVFEKEGKNHEIAKFVIKTVSKTSSFLYFLKLDFQRMCDLLGQFSNGFSIEDCAKLCDLGLCGFALIKGKFSIAVMLYLSGCPVDLLKVQVHPDFIGYCADPFFQAWIQGYVEPYPEGLPGNLKEDIDNVLPYDANIHNLQEHAINTCYSGRENSKAIIAAFLNVYNN